MSRAPLLLVALAGCATGHDGGSDQPPDARIGTSIDAAMPADAPDLVAIDAMEPDAMDEVTPPDAMGPTGPVDTCAQAQNLTTGALTVPGATVTGDTTGYVDNVQPPSSCTGYLPDGPDAVYFVNATAGQTISATVTPNGWDVSIYIIGACVMVPTCLDGADQFTGGTAETATYLVPTAGTYHVVVDGWNPGVEGAYSLNVRVQ